jgi:hypothetical protein
LAEGVMKPGEYVREVVLPTAHEYNRDRRSRRLMYLTCIAVFHIKDHLAKAGEEDIDKRMRSVVGESFDVVRAICNGTSTQGRTARSYQISLRRGLRPPASESGPDGGRRISFRRFRRGSRKSDSTLIGPC